MRTTSLSRSAALFRAVLLCGALSACGGGNGDAPAHVDQPPPPAAAPPAPAAPAAFAYLVQSDKVEVCEIDSGDLLSNCVEAGDLSGYPNLWAMAVAGSNAYIASIVGSGFPATIIHCSIGTAGTFTECSETGPTDLAAPYGLTIRGSELYISDYGSPTVYRCEIKPDGTLELCADARSAGNLPNGAQDLQIVSALAYAYALHYDEGTISRCDIDPVDGSLSGCADASAGGLSNPAGLTISGNHMYVANSTSNSVTRCIINGDSLSDCVDAEATGLDQPSKVAIRGSSAYISNSEGAAGLTRCIVASNGLLTDCASILSEPKALNDIVIR